MNIASGMLSIIDIQYSIIRLLASQNTCRIGTKNKKVTPGRKNHGKAGLRERTMGKQVLK